MKKIINMSLVFFLLLSSCSNVKALVIDLSFNNNIFIMIVYYAIPIICLIISLIILGICKIKSKKNIGNEIIPIEFSLPDGLNSLEVGQLYKGESSEKDVISLLIYLANKGYLKISDMDTNDKLKIIKNKDYDGNNNEERLFLDCLFKDALTDEEGKEFITLAKLKWKFYSTVHNILINVNNVFNVQKIIEKDYSKQELKLKKVLLYLIIIVILSLILIPVLYGGIAIIIKNISYLIGLILGIIIVILMIYIRNIIKIEPKRTVYGKKMFAKIHGFKIFLGTVEKDKLEKLVRENPTYFYDILPFAYVLGVSDKWIKKFEYLKLQSPTWYLGLSDLKDKINSTFDISMEYMTFKSNFYRDSLSSLESSSSSSGDSGGGISGGGSGGGGGGSW